MKKIILLLVVALVILMTGCSAYIDNTTNVKKLSEEDAIITLDSIMKNIGTIKEGNPVLDLSVSTSNVVDELPNIDLEFPIMVKGNKAVNVEFWAATEKSGDGNDGWINRVAEKFNRQYADGSITIRQIDPGPSIDYIQNGKRPDAWSPANPLWHQMIKSKGFDITMVENHLAGNTAGILMKKSVYNDFISKYGELTLEKLIEAINKDDIVLGFTNPYKSDTALNMLAAILIALDPSDPLSQKAEEGFLLLQSKCPPPAINTAQMRESAAKGFIDVMVMERQAYANKTELADYVFTPFGVRHDNPVSIFDDLSAEKRKVLNDFIAFCKNDENQKLATQYGFNNPKDENYEGMPTLSEGSQFYKAQSLWKKNKSGGKQNVAVFVCDGSGSMGDNDKMELLKKSLINSIPYIGDDSAIGLISYSSDNDITIELPLDNFTGQHKGKFVSAVKAMSPSGGTASYSAVAAAMNMIVNSRDKYPNANFSIFLLTDGAVNEGISLNKLAPVIASLDINVHAIGYGAGANESELKKFISYKEGFVQMVDENNVIYNIKSIFNSTL